MGGPYDLHEIGVKRLMQREAMPSGFMDRGPSFPRHYDPCPSCSYKAQNSVLMNVMETMTTKKAEELHILNPISFAELMRDEFGINIMDVTKTDTYYAFIEMWAYLLEKEVRNGRNTQSD